MKNFLRIVTLILFILVTAIVSLYANGLSAVAGSVHFASVLPLIGMALVRFGDGVAEMRKKIGGKVYTKNHYGSIVRTLTKPKNPKTAAQTLIRGGFKYYSPLWRTLGQPIITGFNYLASQMLKSNRLGEKKSMTGETLFIGLNQNTALVGGSQVLTVPTLNEADVQLPKNPNITAIAGVITYTADAPPPISEALALYSSGIVSAGKSFNSKQKFFGTVTNGDTLPLDITAQWSAVFGAVPVAGNVMFFEVKEINKTTGFASLKQTFRVVAS